MTSTERQELRDFLARGVMGWELRMAINGRYYYYGEDDINPWQSDYRPDSPNSPASQLLGVIEAMRGKGFNFCLITRTDGAVAVCFTKEYNFSGEAQFEITLGKAVCLAARAALERERVMTNPKPKGEPK